MDRSLRFFDGSRIARTIFISSSVRVSAVISLLGVMKRPPFVPAEPAKICNADYIRTSVLFQDGIITKW